MIGTRVGGWILEAQIGQSLMGTVYRARATAPRDDGPTVAAVRVLTHPSTIDPAFLQRFPAEWLTLQRLHHPNITAFYDGGVHAGMAYYAYELAPGIDAETRLNQLERTADQPGLSWNGMVFSVAIQAARALKHGHHRSLLHRDLRPGHLIIAEDGSLKIAEFGVAKIFAQSPLSLPNEPMGTAAFLAPEYYTGKPLTRRSDLYALGGVLYTLITGRPPFSANSTAELMHKHCYVLPERPANFVPRLPQDLDELICLLLSKDPGRRPASAAALLEELDRIRGKVERRGERLSLPEPLADPSTTHAALPESVTAGTESSWMERRKQLLRVLPVLLAFLAVVSMILFVFFRPRPSAEELFAAARPLIQSENPNDWDRAIDDYLEPLGRWHPGELMAEVQSARQSIRVRKELRSAANTGSKTKYSSDAERFYYRGLRLTQAGEIELARLTWTAMTRAFPPGTADQPWIELARMGLKEIERLRGSENDVTTTLSSLIDETKKLRSAGQTTTADDMLKAIEFLYRDLPDSADLIRSAR